MFNRNTNPPVRRPIGDLLNTTKLSRLPSLSRQLGRAAQNSLPNSKPFEMPTLLRKGACVSCGGRIEPDHAFLNNLSVCRKCAEIYSRVESAIDQRAEEKFRTAKLAAMSERIQGGANQV